MLGKRKARYARALDVGCAQGEFTRRLASCCDRVTGIDMSAGAVTVAKQRSSGMPNVDFVHGRFPDDGPGGRFDLICYLEALYYVDDEGGDRILERIDAVLDGGVLLLSTNVYGDTQARVAEVTRRLESRFELLDTDLVHREWYYRLELPLLAVLEDINYLRKWRPFAIVGSAPRVRFRRLGWIVSHGPAPSVDWLCGVIERVCRGILGSRALFAAVEWADRRVGSPNGRHQLIVVAAGRRGMVDAALTSDGGRRR